MNAVALMQLAATTLFNASFAWLMGSACAHVWLQPRGTATPALHRHARIVAALRRADRSAVLLCFSAIGGALWSATAAMSGGTLAEAGGRLAPMLTRTAYGHAHIAAALCLLAVGALTLARQRSWWQAQAGSCLLAGIAYLRASVSHAGENGPVSIELGVEWMHLLLIAVWVGGVAVAGWVVLPLARASEDHGKWLRSYLDALSLAATVALAGIIASGIYNGWRRLGSLDALSGNDYGNALVFKLVLVALAVALGGFNKLIGFGAIGSDRGTARALLALRIESVVLTGALAAAAMLTSLQPPASM